jgi:gluconate 2-dehydrogenase gamma chain
MNFTRREWIYGALSASAWAGIAAARDHARQAVAQPEGATFAFLDAAAVADVTAITARILPSDDGPGATEAGAVFFIDRALTTFDTDKQGVYRKGLAEFNERRKQLFPESGSIAALSKDQQIHLLEAVDKSEFFEVIRIHTLLAFLGPPSYGGNRGGVGWKYIGFENRMMWQPPFGYYDAEADK